MAFIPAFNTIRVTLEFTLQGQVVVNVFYLRKATPILSIDLTNIAASIKSWWNTYMKPNFSSALVFTRVILRDMTTVGGLVLDSPVSPPNPGALAAEANSNQVALVTSFGTGLSGRSFKGRAYCCGEAQIDLVDNNFIAGQVLAHTTAWANLNSFVSSSSVIHVIASFFTGGAPRIGALTTPVISYVTNSRCDTQRRRLPK